jgi:flagellar assembly protein FliH
MAGIIKSGTWHGQNTPVQAAEFNFEDMANKADDYLRMVRQQAEVIVNEAKQRAAELEQQAAGKARQAAMAEAAQRLQSQLGEKLNTLLPAVKSAIEEIRVAKQVWLNQWQEETVRLAVAISERIIRRELRQQPEITTDLVREALQLAVGSGQFRLHLHPDDLQTFGPWVEQLTNEMGELAPTDIVADPQLSRGGCRVVTEFGAIDQTFEAQLARIEEELNGSRNPQGN